MKLKNAVTKATPDAGCLTPSMKKAIACVDDIPDGEYLTLRQVADKIGVNASSLSNFIPGSPLESQRIMPEKSHAYWYVNKDTAEKIAKEGL